MKNGNLASFEMLLNENDKGICVRFQIYDN